MRSAVTSTVEAAAAAIAICRASEGIRIAASGGKGQFGRVWYQTIEPGTDLVSDGNMDH